MKLKQDKFLVMSVKVKFKKIMRILVRMLKCIKKLDYYQNFLKIWIKKFFFSFPKLYMYIIHLKLNPLERFSKDFTNWKKIIIHENRNGVDTLFPLLILFLSFPYPLHALIWTEKASTEYLSMLYTKLFVSQFCWL